MSDSESDIEIKSALPKKVVPKKKLPISPSHGLNNKKITTKMMISDALIELKTRKGVSLYAIKKYLTEKYNVNTEKVNYLIKKSIKAGVEDGTFIQMKGIGASGSFKLANAKDKPKTSKKLKKSKKPEKPEKTESETKTKPEKPEQKETKTKTETKSMKSKETKKPKKMEIKKKEKGVEKKAKTKTDVKKPEKSKKNEIEVKPKKAKVKIAKGMQTPTKKRTAMIKRKSIGSIIKKPKMKPKSQA